jgi:tripeptide aminopeptidase
LRSSLLTDLLDLAAVPAPTFEEERRIEWLEQRLAGELGRRSRDEAGNLIWAWGDGQPRLLLLAHVDTVFARAEPLVFAETAGRLVGPGIGDNAAAIVAVIGAVSNLLCQDPEPGAVAFTVGEEGLGDLLGANVACTTLRPAAAIAVEGHGLDQILVDAVGSLRARVRVLGPGGHSWEDRERPSAIHALLDSATQLLALRAGESPVNVGIVSGGAAVNAIAAHAEMLVEMRALEPARIERFEQTLFELEAPSPLALTVEIVGRRPCGSLDRLNTLLQVVRRVRTRLGLPDALEAGSTDANAALALGIPALTLGVARGGNMHTPDEWIEVRSLELGCRQLELVLRETLGTA